MKFLCVPCDSAMKLQSVGPPDGGSLSVVYSCPECGYEMARLLRAEGSSTGAIGSAETASACPFAAMVQGTDDVQHRQEAQPASVRWTAAAEARLARVPAFVRPMAKAGIEKFAAEKGAVEVDEQMLDAAREFFGM
jgi:hypothetical protein